MNGSRNLSSGTTRRAPTRRRQGPRERASRTAGFPRLARAALLGILVAAGAALPSPAWAFFDGCPADQIIVAASGEHFAASPDGSYAGRPGCGSYVVDVVQTLGRDVTFEAQWGPFGVLPQGGPAECENASVSWLLGQHLGGSEYQLVGQGSARGRWIPRGAGGLCLYQTTSGTSPLFIADAPGASYRLQLSAAHFGAPAIVSTSVNVD
jgi:hypothetical protein